MSTEDILKEPVGASWTRVDLHLHTPGVMSFRCPDGADLKTEAGRQRVVERYVESLVASGVQLGAVTDYNGVREAWFGPIRALAAERGITLLPGAELSFQEGEHGLHVLVIFPAGIDPAAINRAIDGLDRDPHNPLRGDDRGHRELRPKESVVEAVGRLREQTRCLVIPPHPMSDKGVLRTYKPKQAAQFLDEVRPDAVEMCTSEDLRRVADTAAVDARWLSALARIESSDPKQIEDLARARTVTGTLRATHLKLSAVDLDALRLALHDPETRVLIGIPPKPSYNRILGMEIEGSGFLGGLRLRWNDELNTVIGGRGVGKSALLETLRYVFGILPYAEESYRDDLVRHALGSGGKATVILERALDADALRRYRVERVLGERPRVTEIGADVPVLVPPAELLGPAGAPTIFGQREIYSVSMSEPYRLRLLDDLIGEEARERGRAVRESIEALRANARTIQDRTTRLNRREEYRQKLQNIEHEIGTYERHGVAEKLREATAIRADGQHLARATGVVEEARRAWQEAAGGIDERVGAAARDLGRGKSSQKQILEEGVRTLDSLRHGLARLAAEAGLLFEATGTSLRTLRERWSVLVKPLEEELNRVKQELRTDALDPDRLLRLTEERTGLGPLLEELSRVESEAEQLRHQRAGLLSEYRERRYAEHALRRERAREVGDRLDGRLRLLVEFKGQKDEAQKRLSSLLRGSSVTADAIQKLVAPDAVDGLAIAEAARQGPKELQQKFGLTAGMAERLVRWIAEDEARLFDLETVEVDDALHVELRVDEGEYRRLDRLSVGQRATAILLLLLAQESRPLVLDQPEDDLDNRFVYEDIVTMLRREKGRRQIIAATHNANIPVLGDAELIVALDARNGRGTIVHRASLDDAVMRDTVKRVMEGGEEAFRRRAQKYGQP